MGLNINNAFDLADKINYGFASNPLGGDPNWAGTSSPYFTVSQELYELTGAIDRIKWDELGLLTASQSDYDNFANILYATPDATSTTNFIDNLAIFHAWLMVMVFPPANLLDIGNRSGLPISYNKLSTYALQHVRDQNDSPSTLLYDSNVFYNALSPIDTPQTNIKPPLFSVIVDSGLNFLNTMPVFRNERPWHLNYPVCVGNFDPYEDFDLGYCNHRETGYNSEIFPQLVAYQLTYYTSQSWAPQDDCGRTSFTYRSINDKVRIRYQEFDEGIPTIERNGTVFKHLFNTNYIPSDGSITQDIDSYYLGTGYRNPTNIAPGIRAPRSQVGFKITSAPVDIGIIDGFNFVKINIPDHGLARGEPLEIIGLTPYDGYYYVESHGDVDNIAIKSSYYPSTPIASSFLYLTNAIKFIGNNPYTDKSFKTRFQDITLDAAGNYKVCGGPNPPIVPYSGTDNYSYTTYTEQGINWPYYENVSLFTSDTMLLVKQFGGYTKYLRDSWLTLSEEPKVTKDYFGFNDCEAPASVIRREEQNLDTTVTNNNGLAELAVTFNGEFKHTYIIGDYVLLENTGGTVSGANGYDGSFEIVDISEDTFTIQAPYFSIALSGGATSKLLSQYTLAGDLFNGTSLMLDAAFKMLAEQSDIRNSNLSNMSDWISTGFFDIQQRLYESIGTINGFIKDAFDTVDRRTKEEVLLTENSLISIEDDFNVNFFNTITDQNGVEKNVNYKGSVEFEERDINTEPSTELIGLNPPSGSVHRVIYGKMPRGVSSPDSLKNSVSNKLWSLQLVGPLTRTKDTRIKITTNDVEVGDDYASVEEIGNLRVVGKPIITPINGTAQIVRSKTTNSLIKDNMTADELLTIHTNVSPAIEKQADGSLTAISSYIPMPTINSISGHDVNYIYNKALPTTVISFDANNVKPSIKFEFSLKANSFIGDIPLDFNDYIQFGIFGEIDGRYTDLTDIFSPVQNYWSRTDRINNSVSTMQDYYDLKFSKYEYRTTDNILIGDIYFDVSRTPRSFFDNTPDMYGILYKRLDIVLYYRDESTSYASSSSSLAQDIIQLPIVTIPVFIYRSQQSVNVDIAYKSGISFDLLLRDTDSDDNYKIVLGDTDNQIVGVAPITLVDLINNGDRLISIGQYVNMLEADIGVSGRYNHNIGPFKVRVDNRSIYKISMPATEKLKIVEAYKKNLLKKGQMFSVEIYDPRTGITQVDPWYLFNSIPSNSNSSIDIFAYIAPAIGNMYRGIREHCGSNPYIQSSGYFNHINRFNNPHKDGSNNNLRLTYE